MYGRVTANHKYKTKGNFYGLPLFYLLYLEFEPFVSRSILSVLDAFLFGVRVPVSFSDDERCLFFFN